MYSRPADNSPPILGLRVSNGGLSIRRILEDEPILTYDLLTDAWRVISRHFPLDRQALTVLWLGTAIIGHSLENMGGSSISHPHTQTLCPKTQKT